MESELVKKQKNINEYIEMSKITIDIYIHKKYYEKVFSLLIMVLERLDNDEKVEFIDYYSKKLYNSIEDISHLNGRRLD